MIIVEVAKDSFLRQTAKDRNDGTSPRLRLIRRIWREDPGRREAGNMELAPRLVITLK
jgi:hypothetical protein